MKIVELITENNLDQLLAKAGQSNQPAAQPTTGGPVSKTVGGLAGFGANLAKGIGQAASAGNSYGSFFKEMPRSNTVRATPAQTAPAVPQTAATIKQAADGKPVNPTGNAGLDKLLRDAGLIQ